MRTFHQKALLFNASNKEDFPVYPYAFIQVPAVARLAGIEVICQDLLGIPQVQWAETVLSLIKQHDPAMILVTLRNTDSLTSQEYAQGAVEAYFPIERTRALIATIRAVSDLKIAVGGFGFSLLPQQLMRRLQPDYGVVGAPASFFRHFQALMAGHCQGIPNLLFFQNGQLLANPRVFDLPLATAEYTPAVIAEMMAFYDRFQTPGFQGAPVEIMRGCCHACMFCSEPHVTGRQVRYRPLSAVMADIEMLVAQGLTRIYLISSELNPEGNAFVLQLADRIQAFNEQQSGEHRVSWFGANYLLNFSGDEYKRLYASGFTGGWFDITALDDENARLMRTPYRNARLIPALKDYVLAESTRPAPLQEGAPQVEVGDGGTGAARSDRTLHWSLFLGNPATSFETLRNTMRIANQEGLAQSFSSCRINSDTRIFDYEEPDPATLAVTYSVTPDLERTAYQQLFPSFACPPALLRDLGSEEAVVAMFAHMAETYLSTQYQQTRNWQDFVAQHATVALISSWLEVLAQHEGSAVPHHLHAEDPVSEQDASGQAARQMVDLLLLRCLQAFPFAFRALGLPGSAAELERLTPYELASVIFRRWSGAEDLAGALVEEAGLRSGEPLQACMHFCLQAMLYRYNIKVDPSYSALFLQGIGTTPGR